ncbi:MAG: sigma-54-dependent Fis family transcriptional regulator [Phycisphaerae bacterium]|nr:sigma-54-dependent Fis family transcriptional regulator [Phycisphaerae bacterium]
MNSAVSSSDNATSGETILIVDDTPANLDLLVQTLEPLGYRILVASTGEAALMVAEQGRPDLVLMDVVLPDTNGYEVCRQLHAREATRETPVLFISARNETDSLVEAFQAGGLDYVTKPIDPDVVVMRLTTHLRVSRLSKELREKNAELTAANDRLRSEIDRRSRAEHALKAADEKLSSLSAQEAERWGIHAFVGQSGAFDKIVHDIRRLQTFSAVNVLITGESGTGKELVARAIHFGSGRSGGPFIAVNCVAIPADLAESMLFGHMRGAFTGAAVDRKGYFELADGGTLFLDEIGDMPAALQAKLLRVLEDGRVTPIGATREKQVDVRVVAATNADLETQIAAGAFRQDLFFRLAQFPLRLPPLRDRPDDIPLLAAHFLKLFATEMGIATPAIEPAALTQLARHPFPGNVRELKNVIERSLIESGGETVKPSHIYLSHGSSPPATSPNRPISPGRATAMTEINDTSSDLPLNLEEAENALIKRALSETNGNIAEAARRLGINRTRIYRKLGGQGKLSLDAK